MGDDRFMFRVLEMYYTNEMSQAEIAKKMNVSRATISRTIWKAKQEGVVSITIHHPHNSQHLLEEEIERQYGLKECIVVPVAEGEDVREKVNYEAVQYLFRVLKDHMTLGITWGLTIGSLIDDLKKYVRNQPVYLKGIKVVPFVGTVVSRETDRLFQKNHASLYAVELAEVLKGIGYQLPAPMYASSPEIKQVFKKDPAIAQVLELSEKADVGLLPVGQLSKEASIVKTGVLPEDRMERLKENGGVGEILGNFFKKDGTIIETDMQERIIGIGREQLMKLPLRIGLAYGKDRILAICGALNSGMINILITDSVTASGLITKNLLDIK